MLTLRLPYPDDLSLLAETVKMEAEGEPWPGKLAVAYAIVNGAGYFKLSLADRIYKPWAFSSWNTGSPTRMRLDDIPPDLWADCYKAACAAAFGLLIDPTHGAIFYMQIEAVMKTAGKLPDWWEIDGDPLSEVKVGSQTFRRHR